MINSERAWFRRKISNPSPCENLRCPLTGQTLHGPQIEHRQSDSRACSRGSPNRHRWWDVGLSPNPGRIDRFKKHWYNSNQMHWVSWIRNTIWLRFQNPFKLPKMHQNSCPILKQSNPSCIGRCKPWLILTEPGYSSGHLFLEALLCARVLGHINSDQFSQLYVAKTRLPVLILQWHVRLQSGCYTWYLAPCLMSRDAGRPVAICSNAKPHVLELLQLGVFSCRSDIPNMENIGWKKNFPKTNSLRERTQLLGCVLNLD